MKTFDLKEVECLIIEGCEVDALNYFATFLSFNISKFELRQLKILELINSDIVGAHLSQIIFNNQHSIEHIRLINLRTLHFLPVEMTYGFKWHWWNRWAQIFKEYIIIKDTSKIISALCLWINFEHQDEFLYCLKEFFINFTCFHMNDSSLKLNSSEQKKSINRNQISDSVQMETKHSKAELNLNDIKKLQFLYKTFVSQKVITYQYKNQQIYNLMRNFKSPKRKEHIITHESKDIIYSSFQVQKELNDQIKSKTQLYAFNTSFWRHPDLRILWSQTEDFGYLVKLLTYRHIICVASGFIGIICWPIYYLCIASDQEIEQYEGESTKQKRIIQAKMTFARSWFIKLSAFFGYVPNIIKLTDSQYDGYLLAIYFLVNTDIHMFLIYQNHLGKTLLNKKNDLPKEEQLLYELSKYKVDFSCFYMRFLDELRDDYFSNTLPVIDFLVSKELDMVINEKLLKIKNAQWRSGLMICCRYLYVDKLVVSPVVQTDQKGIPLEKEPIFEFYEQEFTEIKNSKSAKIIFLFFYLVIFARIVLPSYYFCGYNDFCTQPKFAYFVAGLIMWCWYSYLWIILPIITQMRTFINKRLFSLSRLSELINVQNQKSLYFTPKELPSLNIFCVVSVEAWNNIRKFIITDCQSARNNLDIMLLIIGTQVLVYALLLVLDYFRLFNKEYQYIWSDLVLLTIMIFESILYLGILFMNLKKKADFNLYFDEFKSRFQTIISVLKNFESLSSIYYKQQGETKNNMSVQVVVDADTDIVLDKQIDKLLGEEYNNEIHEFDDQDYLLEAQGKESSAFGQVFSLKSFKMLVQEAKNYSGILVKSNQHEVMQSEYDQVQQYIKQLRKQYKEMQHELNLDKELRSEMFLGFLPITYPILKSLVVALLTFLLGFLGKYIMQLQENTKSQ